MAFVEELLADSCRTQVKETVLDSKKHMHLIWFSSVVTLSSSNKKCN